MNNILDFLQIFEDETDNEHMLTKSQILGKLEEGGYRIKLCAILRVQNKFEE